METSFLRFVADNPTFISVLNGDNAISPAGAVDTQDEVFKDGQAKTQCSVSGENFSPKMAERALAPVLAEISGMGKIANFLPVAQDSAPYGHAVMEFDELDELFDTLSAEQMNILSRCVRECIQCGATQVHIDFFGNFSKRPGRRS